MSDAEALDTALPACLSDEQREELEILHSILISTEIEIEEVDSCAHVTLRVAPRFDDKIRVRAVFGRGVADAEHDVDFHVQSLPPMILHATLPEGYPESVAPSFSLACSYLSAACLSAACSALDALWREQEGMPVLYSWYEWLRNDALADEASAGELVVGDEAEGGTVDARAQAVAQVPERVVSDLLDWERAAREREFAAGVHECPACMESVPGTRCVRSPACHHMLCGDCMQQYLQVCLGSRRVVGVPCPDHSCGAALPDAFVEEVLGPEEGARFRRLQLQSSLDRMSDVAYCPHCETPCIQDDKGFALCGKCEMPFCAHCREVWHPQRRCITAGERLQDQLRTAGDSTSGQGPTRRQIMQELASVNFVGRHTTPCPSCRAPIYKSSGCNKMTCPNCSQFFCWCCRKLISGYDHFGQYSCPLFDEHEIAAWEAMWQGGGRAAPRRPRFEQVADIERARRRRCCPGCGRLQNCDGGNNHMRCEGCRMRFCFFCGRPVVKFAEHFRVADGCPQHGDRPRHRQRPQQRQVQVDPADA